MEIDSATELEAIVNSGIDAARSGILVRNYEGAGRVLMEVLKMVDVDAYETRIKIYDLLMCCPRHQFHPDHAEDALRVTRHIIGNRRLFSRAVHLKAQVVYDGFVNICSLDPLRERSEAYALEAAREELTQSDEMSETRAHALMLSAWFEEDEDCCAAALESLLQDGSDRSITHALVGMSEQFHVKTGGEYLHRAICQVQEPYYRAHLLGKRMGVMVRCLTREDLEECPENFYRIIENIRMCYCNLQLIESASRWRVYAQYYMGVAALEFGDYNLAFFHAQSAVDLAGHIGIDNVKKGAEELILEIEEKRAS